MKMKLVRKQIQEALFSNKFMLLDYTLFCLSVSSTKYGSMTHLYPHKYVLVLFYLVTASALLMPKNRLVKISHITPSLFKNLQRNYGETLICSCSESSLSYQTFVTLEISFNSVCSSTFVSRKWIEGLYLTDASAYSQDDFRVTASSQVSNNRSHALAMTFHLF